jgi:dTDP-4-dehydrorhamnose reductase
MRIIVTSSSGFVGANVAHVFRDRHGDNVLSPSHGELDATDPIAVLHRISDARPDTIVHAAIWKDPPRLLTEPGRVWDAWVGATRAIVNAASTTGARVPPVSTDGVFDGTQGPATKLTPPRPITGHGFKAASEFEVALRATRGTIARTAAVRGVHRARPATPRAQDAGFSYLATSVLEALRTAALLGVELSGLDATLARLRDELKTSWTAV